MISAHCLYAFTQNEIHFYGEKSGVQQKMLLAAAVVVCLEQTEETV